MKPRYQLLLLFAIAGCVFFLRLGRLPLTEPDEGRNAEVAREMLSLDDSVTPHYDGLPYLDKPAVFFWLVAGSFRLFGVSEWAARLPSALAALLTTLLVWLLARRMFGERAGLAAGVVFATSPLVMIFSRVVVFDMTLTFLVTLALTAFWFARESEGRPRVLEYTMFIAIGMAAITKGPVGFLLPAICILLDAIVERRFADLRKVAWLPGLALFLAVSLPWFVVVSVRNPGFPRYAFWDESLLRFATGHAHRGGSLFYYIPVFLVGFLPWSVALVFACLNRLPAWKRLRDASHSAEAFLLCWAATVFVFFSISHSKLPAYFLPAVPALAMLMGKVWSGVGRDAARPRPDWLTASYAVLIALGLLVAVAPAWMQVPSLHKVLVRKIHPSVLPLLGPSLFYSGLIMAALGVLGRNLAARTRARAYAARCFAVLAVAMPLVALRCWPAIETGAAASSTKRLAQAIRSGPERYLPVYGYYYCRTSLPFYLRHPVGLVSADGDELTSNYIIAHWPKAIQGAHFGMRAGDESALPLFMGGSEFTEIGRSARPFLLLVRNSEVPEITRLEGTLQATIDPLWDTPQYSVWKVSSGEEP